jgi:hypothetical protein
LLVAVVRLLVLLSEFMVRLMVEDYLRNCWSCVLRILVSHEPFYAGTVMQSNITSRETFYRRCGPPFISSSNTYIILYLYSTMLECAIISTAIDARVSQRHCIITLNACGRGYATWS